MGVLADKVAIVTGGSRGIGRAIVERLSRDGAFVVFTYLRGEARARELVESIKANGGHAYGVAADMGHLPDVERIFSVAKEQSGGLDILVNNAAELFVKPIAETTVTEWERVMSVNARGPFFAIKEAAKCLRDGGRIINISSLNTIMSEPGVAVYAAAKAALEQIAKVAAWELAPRGIAVNTVSPGPTNTEFLRANNPPAVLEQAAAMIPLGRIGEPADIADIVAFLVGPDSRWLTGQNLRATGGMG